MLKRIIIIATALLVVSACTAAYIYLITIPPVLRNGITSEIESATGRKVFIGSFGFSLLKGLVLEDVILYDRPAVIFRAKEISCVPVPASLLKKRLVIPVINVESPSIRLIRRPDNSFNISDIIPKDYKPKSGVTLNVYKISLKKVRVDFIDETLTPNFEKRINIINAGLNLLPVDKVVFTLECAIPGTSTVDAKLSGEYSVSKQELYAKIIAENISLKDFDAYYKDSGISFPEGSVGVSASLDVKSEVINAAVTAVTKGLMITKDKLILNTDSAVRAAVRYETKDRKFEYSGEIDVAEMSIDGVEGLGRLENIKARVEFDESRLHSKDISVEALGIPWNVKINLINFANPLFDIYANSSTGLAGFKKSLEDKFNMKIPAEISGKGDIAISIQVERDKPARINGNIFMHDSIVILDTGNLLLEHVNGQTRFGPDIVEWSDLDLEHKAVAYKTSGFLKDFVSPKISLKAASRNLSFESTLETSDNFIAIDRLKGRYFNSEFSVSGDIDIANPDIVDADIEGVIELDLRDLKGMVKKSGILEQIKPSGRLRAEFDLAGDIGDIKKCAISANVKSEKLSLYGFNMADVVFEYKQEDLSGHIKSMQSVFYGGTIRADGKIDWHLKGLPYSFTIDMKDVRLGKFKNDTGLKDKDISGDIKVYAAIKGLLEDSPSISGVGKISITNGRLWQLNLFKGLGAIIFTSDFSDIVFTEGSCDFKIASERASTSDLILKSWLLDLAGSGRVGFDKSISASIRARVAEEAMSPGLGKNIANAIGKYTFVEVSGTVVDPKYKIRPSASDIIGDLAFFKE